MAGGNMFSSIFILICYLKVLNCQLLGLPENSPCGNAGGTCRILQECPIVGNPRLTRPPLCSFIGRDPVVCCPPSRALEMCIMYDRMACNGVDSARRRRDTENEPDGRRGLLISVDSLSEKDEEVVTSTTLRSPTTTRRRGTTTASRYTTPTSTSPRSGTSTTTTQRIITTTTSGSKSTTTPSSARRSTTTTIPRYYPTNRTSTTTTMNYDSYFNSSWEEDLDGSVRSIIGGLSKNLNNDIVDPKVVGGSPAMPKELPYMALIGYGTGANREWSCGASIISENFVMSAAHCANNALLGPARWTRIGELDLSREDSPHEDIPIIARFVHPGYREPAVYNDIAVFRLGSRIVFSSWIQPICLQVAPSVTAARGVAAGWGRTDFVGDTSERLLKVDLSLVDAAQCRALLGRAGRFLPQGVNMDTMICAGEKEGGKDTCTGDSGGPLVVQGIGRCIRTQIGVVSFGRQCARPDTPGIYTKVSSFVPWIENIVWPQGRL